jgi:hypothetical protein
LARRRNGRGFERTSRDDSAIKNGRKLRKKMPPAGRQCQLALGSAVPPDGEFRVRETVAVHTRSLWELFELATRNAGQYLSRWRCKSILAIERKFYLRLIRD